MLPGHIYKVVYKILFDIIFFLFFLVNWEKNPIVKSIKKLRDALTGNRTRAKSLATIYCTIQLSTLFIWKSCIFFCVFFEKNQRDALTGNRTRAKSLATIYCTIQLSTLVIFYNFFFIYLRSGTCRDRTCDLSVNSRTRCRCAKEPHCIYFVLYVCYI